MIRTAKGLHEIAIKQIIDIGGGDISVMQIPEGSPLVQGVAVH